ncbi:MAG: bis-aminopropyl spermidine synthase family protein [Candidatus Hinthialibacter antarcticus]|nr:bis-aminopropyl spermidine synthase family protein [Candidatus Hinthialibacter antarcticus]
MKQPETIEELNLWLSELAKSVRLREGVEGVTRALWALYQNPGISTHDWSWHVQIPVPVMAALRRELEKRDVLKEVRTLVTTPNGDAVLERLFGNPGAMPFLCSSCQGRGNVLPPQAMQVVEEFAAICDERPDPDMALDQSHATPETGILKALFLLNKGLLGRSLFFMGDDDLTSVACYLVRKQVYQNQDGLGTIAAADIDSPYLDLIQEVTDKSVETLVYDARTDFPSDWQGKFDVALTDPPYTLNGASAFAYRCREATTPQGTFILSMPPPGVDEWWDIQQNLLQMGWSLRETHPQFNEYEGASIHAHASSLYLWEKSSRPSPEIELDLRYTPFYTGERRAPGGTYACTLCGTEYEVGPEKECASVQELKSNGCDECENDKFRRVSKPPEETIK